MRKTPLEIAEPSLWLRQLSEDSAGYSRLVSESKGMVRAAYRLARARCSVESGESPSLKDLQAAAELLAARVGGQSALPIKSLLPGALDTSSAQSERPSASLQPSSQAALRSVPPPAPSSMRRP
ncbi:MAG TPA: hypothetical protein VHW01_12295, partial [Polyangiaceae bacterium]|nr:hypothetical protein [Polyangiaceae bacterium]